MTITNNPTDHRLAPPAGGGGRRVTIRFGLVSVPVSIKPLVEDSPVSGIKRSMFVPHVPNPGTCVYCAKVVSDIDGKGWSTSSGKDAAKCAKNDETGKHEVATEYHEVGYRNYDKVTGAAVANEQIVKMAETSKGERVLVDDDEIVAVTGGVEKGLAEIEALIPLDAIGSVYVVEKRYSLTAQTTGTGKAKKVMPGADKALALIVRALQVKGVAALMRVALTGPARPVALLPDGTLAFLYYADAVRADSEVDVSGVSEKELDLALRLLDSLDTEVPVLRDETSPKLQRYVDEKAGSGAVITAVDVEDDDGSVIDLSVMLEASLAATAAPAKPKRAAKKAS